MWLLESSIKQAIEYACKNNLTPSVEDQVKYEARFSSDSDDENYSSIMTTAGDTAEISIKGTITKGHSLMASIFGGGNVTYPEIINALSIADKNPSVKNIVLAIDSPGGQFDGLFDAVAALQATQKPIEAKVYNVCASAAYALATQADKITANNRAARIGSVGVVATFYNDPEEISITSSEAPKKRPDINTEEGREMIVEELDALHEIFVDAIAEGRKTTTEKINADYGRGGTLLANEALNRGMIDAIADPVFSVVGSASTTTASRNSGVNLEKEMDLNELKAQHPAVYEAAVKVGIDQERDRVSAHLTMGEASGDMKTALEACADGSEMTAKIQATYMAAGMARKDVESRQADEANAGAGDNAQAEEDQKSMGDQVADLVEASMGLGAL